jgi:hypothetical protein
MTCLPSCWKTKLQRVRLLWGPQTSFSSCKTSNLPSRRNVLSHLSGMIMQGWRQNVTRRPAFSPYCLNVLIKTCSKSFCMFVRRTPIGSRYILVDKRHFYRTKINCVGPNMRIQRFIRLDNLYLLNFTWRSKMFCLYGARYGMLHSSVIRLAVGNVARTTAYTETADGRHATYWWKGVFVWSRHVLGVTCLICWQSRVQQNRLGTNRSVTVFTLPPRC